MVANLWAIVIGAGAIALPVVIHWLTKPRPRTMQLSTIRFVQEAVRQRRARHRLRDFILLSLRVIAVALVAAAFARPLLGERPVVTADSPGDSIRIIVVDQSLSMGARVGGTSPFERARAVAAGYLTYRPGLLLSMIFAAAKPRTVFETPSRNVDALRDELSQVQPLPQQCNLNAAIALAAQIFEESSDKPNTHHELVIVSDLQRSTFAAADFSSLPKDTHIQLESTALDEPPCNIGVLAVRCPAVSRVGAETVLEVDIGNYCPSARNVQVRINVGDATDRLEGICPPGTVTTLAKKIVLPTEGWVVGEATILSVDDAIAADNVRAFSLQIRPAPLFAMITRQADDNTPTSSYFLSRALAPYAKDAARSTERIIRMNSDAPDEEALSRADLVTLVCPGTLRPESIQTLTAMLKRGVPMLYAASEPADAINLKNLANALGRDWRVPVEFAPRSGVGGSKSLMVADVRQTVSPFRIFGDRLPSIIKPLRMKRVLDSRRVNEGLGDDILATYSNGAAFVTRGDCGASVATIMNVDLAASNFPASTGFVPIITEIVTDAIQRRGADTDILCGESFSTYLPGAKSRAGLSVSTHDGGDATLGEFVDDKAGIVWRCGESATPGGYLIRQNGNTIHSFAVSIHGAESDLRSISTELIKGRLAGGRELSIRSASRADESIDTLWSTMAAVCAMCMLTEIGVLRLFRT